MFPLLAVGGLVLVAHARLIVVASSRSASLTAGDLPCSPASMIFLGSFAQGRQLVFDAPAACAKDLQGNTSAYNLEGESVLYSIVPAGLDPLLLAKGWSFEHEVHRVLQAVNRQQFLVQDPDSVSKHTEREVARIIHRGTDGALLLLAPGFDAIRRLDRVLSEYPGLSLVELQPSSNHTQINSISDKEPSIAHLEAVLANLTFNGDVATFVSSVSAASIRADLTWLTGEAEGSPLWTRHSFSDSALLAADWLLQTFEREGGARCQLWHYRKGFSPNVVCDFAPVQCTPRDAPLYILGAHYDSRGSFGSTRAPGMC